MIFYYHKDADGICAAKLLWLHSNMLSDKIGDRVKCVPMKDYEVRINLADVQADEKVYIVDYSIPEEDMDSLLEITNNVVWIDHHKSVIERYAKTRPQYDSLKGIRKIGVSGCMLTYEYLKEHVRLVFDDKEVPAFIRYVNDWDVWIHELPETKDYIAAFNAYDLYPQYNWSNDILNVTPKIIEEGKAIRKHIYTYGKMYAQSQGFSFSFKGHRTFAMNLWPASSEYFTSLEHDGYDVYMCFSYNGNADYWNFSIYSVNNKVDCAKLASLYGGGGHAGAAGFTAADLQEVINS